MDETETWSAPPSPPSTSFPSPTPMITTSQFPINSPHPSSLSLDPTSQYIGGTNSRSPMSLDTPLQLPVGAGMGMIPHSGLRPPTPAASPSPLPLLDQMMGLNMNEHLDPLDRKVGDYNEHARERGWKERWKGKGKEYEAEVDMTV
ncbi:hypothetical protein M231_01987 [Tremella mesenterica]|uniref:Uncharacterized protein n=1 Tax=Tremella mesenterica TaxID=5217 RepID=A0A4Q1BRX9_TREME|nr:hypothetical protein M231_01987 [Tremella mesenterica]